MLTSATTTHNYWLGELRSTPPNTMWCLVICVVRYSSGAVYLWTLTSEEGPIALETDHTHLAMPTLCRIHQGWGAVATQHGMNALTGPYTTGHLTLCDSSRDGDSVRYMCGQ